MKDTYTYEAFKSKTLKENRLIDTLNLFETDKEKAWHIQRHSLESYIHASPVSGVSFKDLGILLGIEILKEWTETAKSEDRFILSQPILIIEDEWLNNTGPHSAPPVIYICMARDKESFEQATFGDVIDEIPNLSADVDRAGFQLGRWKRSDDGTNDWLIRVSENND